MILGEDTGYVNSRIDIGILTKKTPLNRLLPFELVGFQDSFYFSILYMPKMKYLTMIY